MEFFKEVNIYINRLRSLYEATVFLESNKAAKNFIDEVIIVLFGHTANY